MHKLQRAAVVAALLSSAAFLGAGTAHADGKDGGPWGGNDIGVSQSTSCKSHDTNVDVLGNVGIANGLAGNALGGEGDPGANQTKIGSVMGCDNSAF